MTTYFSIGEVADILQLPSNRIIYSHTSKKTLEPARVLGRRAYTWRDIQCLAEHFGVALLKQEVCDERK